ncbi:T9SS type A sorting domain-containing protein [Pontibacter kalidii]|uniref:T9SS type A sorting domain-containing protein n=1 Tax=Pontibacter kalidii TaxID=2592049 RepID=UPI00225520DE|nr:T9SS type A sorting domain-containing protein [Pontibacter kalidii]
MKLIFTLAAALFLFAFTTQAQEVVVYEQNFAAAPSNISTSTWTIDNKYPNGTTGGSYYRTRIASSTGTVKQFTLSKPISTMGMLGLMVTWQEYRTQHWRHNDNSQTILKQQQNSNSTKVDNTNPIVLEYSLDGVNYSSKGVSFTQNTNSFYTWAPINGGNPVFLPADVLNQEKVYLRWTITVNAVNEDFYAMDDLRIVGEEEQVVAPLPVELMYFKGAVQGANASLTWATAQEINNEKFIVERSQDGRSFSKIGEVQGHGNSSTLVSYTFTDTSPAQGTNYYRLRQVDFGGAEEASNLVALQFKGMQHVLNGNIAKVYPTIAATEVSVSLTLGNAQVTVLNASGLQVAQYSNASQHLVLPVSHLQPGVYFVKVSDGTQQQTQRFVKR